MLIEKIDYEQNSKIARMMANIMETMPKMRSPYFNILDKTNL